ncbi:hypothetical protein C8Q80DRAFT_1275557 [Daedaleopsis nitida]|nr:hypothetical protein C8Q80DRAFT_1275557 [Daedaleopsis nitida]
MSPSKKARTDTDGNKDSPTASATINDSACCWYRLPSELRNEVYDYLTPPDLLNLFMVSKAFYEFFKGSASATHWIRACENMKGLPDRPPWLSEIQYASLCFDKHCQRCLQVDESTELALWHVFVRLCALCKEIRTIDLDSYEGLSGFGRKIEKILPFFTRDGSVVGQAYFFRSDLDDFSLSLDGAIDRENVIARRQALTKEHRQYAVQCDHWEKATERARKQHLDEIRNTRYEDIYAIVQAHDYGPEMHNLGIRVEALPRNLRDFVQKAEPLSHKEQCEIMCLLEPALLERRTFETRRLYVNCLLVRLDLVDEVLSHHRPTSSSPREIFPSVLDLVDIPTVRNTLQLEREIHIRPYALYQIIPRRIPEWRNTREKAVLSLLTDLLPILSSAPLTSNITTRSTPIASPLEHHGALFWCGCCNQLVSGIAAQIHACCYRFDAGWRSLHPPGCAPWTDGRYSCVVIEGDPTLEDALLVHSRGFRPWCSDTLLPCTDIVIALWKACGANLGSTAHKTVVERARFTCSSCSITGKAMVVMDWCRAVHHVFAAHSGHRVPWQKVCSVFSDKAKRLEYNALRANLSETYHDGRWSCQLCPWPRKDRTYRYADLQEHLQAVHPYRGIHNQDAIRSHNSPEFMHPSIVLYESTLDSEDLDTVAIGLRGLKGDRKEGAMRFPKNAWTT